jgi:hypothetical protein
MAAKRSKRTGRFIKGSTSGRKKSTTKRKSSTSGAKKTRCIKWAKGRTRCMKRAKK